MFESESEDTSTTRSTSCTNGVATPPESVVMFQDGESDSDIDIDIDNNTPRSTSPSSSSPPSSSLSRSGSKRTNPTHQLAPAPPSHSTWSWKLLIAAVISFLVWYRYVLPFNQNSSPMTIIINNHFTGPGSPPPITEDVAYTAKKLLSSSTTTCLHNSPTIPRPGLTYQLRLLSLSSFPSQPPSRRFPYTQNLYLALLAGRITLSPSTHQGSTNWHLRTSKEWFGLQDPISSCFLGRDASGRLHCKAESQRGWETFVFRHVLVSKEEERSGYGLMMQHYERLWRVGFEESFGSGGGMDGRTLAKIPNGEHADERGEQGLVWEFVEV